MLRQHHLLWTYVENPMASVIQRATKANEFSKGAGYKIIVQTSIVFL